VLPAPRKRRNRVIFIPFFYQLVLLPTGNLSHGRESMDLSKVKSDVKEIALDSKAFLAEYVPSQE